MANCKYCGQEVKNGEKYCSNCGAEQIPPQEATAPQQEPAPAYNQNLTGQPSVVDNGGFGWGLLGCCVPLAGLILFLVWKDTKPKTAKAAGIGALVSVGISILLYIISAIIGVSAGLMGL